MTKARAIRNVTAEDKSISNKEIKDRVKDRFGLDVETNHIIELVGPYRERKNSGPAGKTLNTAAEKYLNIVGDRRLAVQLINSIAVL